MRSRSLQSRILLLVTLGKDAARPELTADLEGEQHAARRWAGDGLGAGVPHRLGHLLADSDRVLWPLEQVELLQVPVRMAAGSQLEVPVEECTGLL